MSYWKQVKNASELKHGQRVRYQTNGIKIGYGVCRDDLRTWDSVSERTVNSKSEVQTSFSFRNWDLVEAMFDDPKPAITRIELDSCLNAAKQAWDAMPPSVKKLMNRVDRIPYVQQYTESGTWVNRVLDAYNRCAVYRLDPAMPTAERDWVEYPVTTTETERGFYCYEVRERDSLGVWYLSSCVNIPGFLGVVYLKDGIETLHTSLDAAFGVPKRVRCIRE
jgi:hypothetical protein